MAGPNLNGTSLFAGFIDPGNRKEMQNRRKMLPLTQVLSPARKTDTTLPGFGGGRSTGYGGPRSIFTRFGNAY